MLDIRKMKITTTEVDDNKDCVSFVIEPLERGYGTTFGSSLRRILLSSLNGAAVTSYKLTEGSLDEAQLCDLTLNLKDLSLEIKSEEAVTVTYTAVGPTLVCAEDVFGANEAVNAVNGDQPIIQVPEGMTICLSLIVEPGHGYAPAGKLAVIDPETTPLDALFSPVRRVDYKVQNTRVGNVTDYDSLTLTIHTDGTITPAAAFTTAAGLMIDKLTAFTDLFEDDENDAMFSAEEPVEAEVSQEDVLSKPLDELDLSVRSYNALKRHGINTIGDLIGMTEESALRIRNLGRTSFLDIKSKLASFGLDFKKEEI